MSKVKRWTGIGLAGALAVAALSVAGAHALTRPADGISLVQQEGSAEDDGERARGRRPKMLHGMRGAVRGEFVVAGEEEGTFQTVRVDRGVLQRVEAATLVIEEADGTIVAIPTSGDTRVGRDGDEAELSDLRAGDHVLAHRVDDRTRHVRAMSPERHAEMEQRREACAQDRDACPRPDRGRRGPGAEAA